MYEHWVLTTTYPWGNKCNVEGVEEQAVLEAIPRAPGRELASCYSLVGAPEIQKFCAGLFYSAQVQGWGRGACNGANKAAVICRRRRVWAQSQPCWFQGCWPFGHESGALRERTIFHNVHNGPCNQRDRQEEAYQPAGRQCLESPFW